MSSYLHVTTDGRLWFFSMPSILKNVPLAEQYLQLVKKGYSEPANEMIIGSFITEAFPEPLTLRTEGQPKVCNRAKKKQNDFQPNIDIREMFQAVAQMKLKKNSDKLR